MQKKNDGVYIRPCPDDYVLQVAVNNACSKLGVPVVNIKVTNLLVTWQLKFSSLLSSRAIACSINKSKRARFETKYAVTHTNKHKRKSLTLTSIESADTLYRFFKKKKLVD